LPPGKNIRSVKHECLEETRDMQIRTDLVVWDFVTKT